MLSDSLEATSRREEIMPDRVYDSRAVANYLISKSDHGLDALQVMKLTYIAHGFTLGHFDRPLIEGDVEAWRLGPVVRQIYAALPRGPSPIQGALPAFRSVADLQDGERSIVDGIFKAYGNLSGLRLSSLTHRVGSPWERTWSTYGQNAVIPQSLIKTHYKNVIDSYKSALSEGRPYVVEAL